MKKDMTSKQSLPKPFERTKMINNLKEHYHLKPWLLEFFTNEELSIAVQSETETDDYLISLYLSRTLN